MLLGLVIAIVASLRYRHPRRHRLQKTRRRNVRMRPHIPPREAPGAYVNLVQELRQKKCRKYAPPNLFVAKHLQNIGQNGC